jgi:type VI protein secretion system component Hcp
LGKANRNTAKCEFIIMRANSAGNQETVATINLTNCFNSNTSPLIKSAIDRQFRNIPGANKIFDGYSHYD